MVFTFSVLLVLYLIVGIGIFFLHNWLIFPAPPPGYNVDNAWFALEMLESEDDEKVAACMVKHPEARVLVLYSHGNGEDLSGVYSRLHNISQKFQATVVGYDYPGYGASTGRSDIKGAIGAARLAMEFLREKGGEDLPLVLWGYSLGGGVSAQIIDEGVDAIIFESSFDSILRVPFYFSIFPFDYLESAKMMASNEVPLLVIHGTADRIVPFARGRRLYEKAAGPKKNLWLTGGKHFLGSPEHRIMIEEAVKTFFEDNQIGF